jgi:hypothetical protein
MRIWEESKQRFGARMMWAALPCAFSSVSLYRVQKIMRGLASAAARLTRAKGPPYKTPELKRSAILSAATSPALSPPTSL